MGTTRVTGAILALLASAAAARAGDRVIEAKELNGGAIVLKDKDGNTRCRVQLRPDGSVLVFVADEKGRTRFEAVVEPDGAAQWMHRDATGQPTTGEALDGNGQRVVQADKPFQRPKKPKQRSRGSVPKQGLDNLQETTPQERERIDKLIEVMFDVHAGKDSLTAMQALVLMDKKAFPRVLAKMARIHNTMTDVDSMEERLLESSLKLADACLREMDGYLETHGKPMLRPGTSKRYVAYILRLHHKRWTKELSKMKKMPGPFDPASNFEKPEAFADSGK